MNVYIAEVAKYAERKHCPHCSAKLDANNSVVSVGEYVSGTYRRGFYACRECITMALRSRLGNVAYMLMKRSGCTVRWLRPRHADIGYEIIPVKEVAPGKCLVHDCQYFIEPDSDCCTVHAIQRQKYVDAVHAKETPAC